MNEFGVASPTTFLTLLEKTAADHCYSINYSLYQLAEQNIGWVLFSGINTKLFLTISIRFRSSKSHIFMSSLI